MTPAGSAAQWVRRGVAELRSGRDASAAECFLKAQKNSPGDEASLIYLGEIFARAGRYEKAVEFFSAAAKRNPSNPMVYAFQSQIKRRLGRTEDGLKDIEKAISLDARCLWMLSLGYGRTENKSLYRREFESLDALAKRRPDWGLVYVARGVARAHAHEKELDQVVEDIKRGMALDPSCSWALAWLAEAHRWEEKYAEAVKYLDRAVKARPDDPNLFVRRGETRVWTGEFVKAVEDFDRAVALDPATGSVVAWRAEIKLWGGDYSGALADSEASLRAASPALWAHCWRGAALHMLGRPALHDLDVALKRDPVDAEALTWRGEVHRLAGRMKPALADLDLAVKLRPFATSYVNRALAWDELGNQSKCIADFEEFRRVAPKLARAAGTGTSRRILRRALELSLGNRTAHPTFASRRAGRLFLRSAW